MLGLGDLKQTRAYQEAEQAGEEKNRAAMLEKIVPLLLTKGMTVEEIAANLDFSVETIQPFASQK